MKFSRGEIISLVVASFLLIFGLFFTFFEKYPQKFISVNTTDLEHIGQFNTTHGKVERKLLNDSIWLQVGNSDKIYSGDRIRTASSAEAEIELTTPSGDNIVHLPKDTYVRIYKRSERIHLQIATGEAEVEAKDNAEPIALNTKRPRPTTGEQNQSGQESPTANSDEKQPQTVAGGTTNPFQKDLDGLLPYPSDGSVIFHNQRGEVSVHPIKLCLSPCVLSVSVGEKKQEQNFDANTSPEIKLNLSEYLDQDVQWILTAEGQSLTGGFFIRKFSPKALDEAMKKKQKTEVVY